jgi:hypothetical protein
MVKPICGTTRTLPATATVHFEIEGIVTLDSPES